MEGREAGPGRDERNEGEEQHLRRFLPLPLIVVRRPGWPRAVQVWSVMAISFPPGSRDGNHVHGKRSLHIALVSGYEGLRSGDEQVT